MSIRNLEVSPVHFGRDVVGYSISGIIRDCPDSLWDPIWHNAIFRTRERAERFLARVLATNTWDLKLTNWRVGATWDGKYSAL